MKIKSYDWLLCGCHALSEVAIAYFPNFQYNSSAVRAFRRTITEHPALPQQLARAQGNKRRRSDTRMRGRSRLLSGVGQRAGGTTFRGCYQYSRRRETLARGGTRQLVLAFGHRSAR